MSDQQPEVQTTAGPISGRTRQGIQLYAGIPYAAPPVGPLRFKPPQSPPPWREARDARRFGAAAPQRPSGGMTDSANVRWDEDCLTLNVQTPAADSAQRPVLVWIHGGGFRSGQGAIPWYNGNSFCRQGDVVVVTINYRLGALGYTDLSRFGSGYENSGVLGLLDQIAALEWVRDNISRFGGDPAKVTIAGESAGAFSVCSLLAADAAHGLFRGAIAQSGGGHHTLPKAAGEAVADAFLAHTGAQSEADLQALTVEDILDAQEAVTQALGGGSPFANRLGVAVQPFYPVHGTPLLPTAPIAAIQQGAGADVALLTGSNGDETTLWGYGDVDPERVASAVAKHGLQAPYTAIKAHSPNASAAETMIRLTTDHMFTIPMMQICEARDGAPAPTWMYRFTWRSRAFEGRLGATHALEIPFAFNTLGQPGVDLFLGPGETPQALAEEMHADWIGFVRNQQLPWPRYALEERASKRYDEPCALEKNAEAAARAAWSGLR